MSDGYLTIDHGQVHLGGQRVPGVLVTMEIGNEVRFDTAEADNLSGKKKTPMGWEDSVITIELDLITEEGSTCYDKLALLNGVFKGMDNHSNPKVFDIVNAHVLARGVDQVVFRQLRSKEDNEFDVVRAVLYFDEHNPPTIPPEIKSSTGQDGSATPQADGATEVVADAEVTADPGSPFDRGFNAGVS